MYYILYNGAEIGPMSAQQILNYNPNQQTPVRCNPAEPWRPLYTFPELMGMLNGTAHSGRTSDKDKVVAGVLALLLGTLGIQYFYLGKTAGGLLTILLSLVTCGCWSIVTFIQGILMLTMSDAEFERKFVYSTSTLPLF